MPILKLLVRRLLLGVLTIFVVSVVVFGATQIMPSDPARAILGREASAQSIKALDQQLGLDKPKLTQYTKWAKGVLTGNPGKSFTTRKPILSYIGPRVRNSAFLVLCASLVSLPISLAVGAYSAWRRDRLFDNASSVVQLFVAAMPEFVVGTLLLSVFALNVFHLLPPTSTIRPEQMPWSQLKRLVLPTITLSLGAIPYVSRVMRASMVEVLESDYVEMARLKGLPERTVVWRHAVPNALAPTFQVMALSLAYFAGGVIIVERLFNYPGIGSALADAVRARDLPVIQFLAMVIAAVYVLTNLAADLGTILVTPRLRTSLR